MKYITMHGNMNVKDAAVLKWIIICLI